MAGNYDRNDRNDRSDRASSGASTIAGYDKPYSLSKDAESFSTTKLVDDDGYFYGMKVNADTASKLNIFSQGITPGSAARR